MMGFHRFLGVLSVLVSPAAAQGPAPVLINAPYVTSPDRVVSAMLQLAGVTKSDTLYDLGCGDGRIVVAAAKLGAHGVGIDINPERIREARANVRKAGVEALARFEAGDLFDANISAATVITLYLLPDLNLRLRPKLMKELKPGTRVVSHAFDMGDWIAEKKRIVQGSPIYLWTISPK